MPKSSKFSRSALAKLRLRAWAQQQRLSEREALHRLLDIAEGKDVLAFLAVLRQRYEAGVTPDELAVWDVLYSWLAHVFDYRAPG